MPPHVQLDQYDDLQESTPLMTSSPCGESVFLESPLFQDDQSSHTSRSASPLDALRNDDDCSSSSVEEALSSSSPMITETKKRISGIEAIIGSESAYIKSEMAVNSSSSTLATTSTATTATTTTTSSFTSLHDIKKMSKTVNNGLKSRRKKVVGFFRKGKKIASSIVNKKSKSKKKEL